VRIPVFLLLCLGLVSGALAQDRLVEGGLYSYQNETRGYSVLKILKLDPQGVHVRMYSNHFSEHPEKLNEATLHLAGVERAPKETLGIGHAPISTQGFASLDARFIKQVPVKDEELEGYRAWKAAKGGYY
jgi:hypothetical protein